MTDIESSSINLSTASYLTEPDFQTNFRILYERIEVSSTSLDYSFLKHYFYHQLTKTLSVFNPVQIFAHIYGNYIKSGRNPTNSWKITEKAFLAWIIASYIALGEMRVKKINYELIANIIPTKSKQAIADKIKRSIVLVSRRSYWRTEYDQILDNIANKNNLKKWKNIAKEFNDQIQSKTIYSARNLRNRWIIRYKTPSNSNAWTKEDDCKLLSLYLQNGCKWSYIASKLLNRLPISIKNRLVSLVTKESDSLTIRKSHLIMYEPEFARIVQKLYDKLIDKSVPSTCIVKKEVLDQPVKHEEEPRIQKKLKLNAECQAEKKTQQHGGNTFYSENYHNLYGDKSCVNIHDSYYKNSHFDKQGLVYQEFYIAARSPYYQPIYYSHDKNMIYRPYQYIPVGPYMNPGIYQTTPSKTFF